MSPMEEKVPLNFWISKDLGDKLDQESARLNISKADFMRMRLVEYFEKKEGGTNGNPKPEPETAPA